MVTFCSALSCRSDFPKTDADTENRAPWQLAPSLISPRTHHLSPTDA